MPEYLAPGVYVEEVDTGIRTIEGVSTSIVGMIGVTRRGPSQGLPRLVTSFAEFERQFGGFFDFPGFAGFNFLPHAVNGFFTNGGRQLYVLRVKRADATLATATARGGLITRLRPGNDALTGAGNNTFVPLTLRGIHVADGGVPATRIRLIMVKDGITYTSNDANVTAINRDTGVVTLSADIDTTPAGQVPAFEARYTTVLTDVNALDTAPAADVGLVTSLAAITDPRQAAFSVSAKDEGSWGREIVVNAAHETPARSPMPVGGNIGGVLPDETRIRLDSTKGFYTNAWVEIDRGLQKRYRRVRSVDGNILTLFGPPIAAADLAGQGGAATIASVCEFRLSASWGSVSETFSGLTLENIPGKFYRDIINNESLLINAGAPAGTDPLFFPSGPDGVRIPIDTAGSDGSAPQINDYIGGGTPGNRTGLRALEDIDRISIIAVPGRTDLAVMNVLIEQCERLKDRFAIVDPSTNTVPGIQAQRQQFDTKYGAIYFPRLRAFDPLSEVDITIPPSGHMAGIYARVDIERGVHKAPANEVVRGITGYEVTINKETQDVLNPGPMNVNVFRDFRADGRGLRIWGARVMTSDTMWRYINVRRLFIFLEESIDEGTQWVVFEPNDERLWARVRQSIAAFLTRVWRDGALMGTTPEEAFFVKCDRTTMTQDDLDNGRLIVLVGVAPVRPAEFVIIRISQFTANAETEA